MAALEISIASVVLPVPTSPVNQMPAPLSSCSAIVRAYWRTSRTTCGLERSIETSGSRSNATPR